MGTAVMRQIGLLLIALMLVAGGCRQASLGRSAAKGPSPDDVVGKYAAERGISREKAALTIRREMDAARVDSVPSSGATETVANGSW